MKARRPIIGVTMGDPAGIGPEIALKAATFREVYQHCRPLVIGDYGVMEQARGFAGAPVPSATGSTPEAQHANPPPPHGPAIAPLQDIALGTTTWLGVSGAGDAPQQAWPAPIGGTAGAGLVPVGLWSSTDAGNDWQQLATDLPVFASNYYAQATGAAYVGREPVVVGTVDGRLMVWVGAPAAGAPAGTG